MLAYYPSTRCHRCLLSSLRYTPPSPLTPSCPHLSRYDPPVLSAPPYFVMFLIGQLGNSYLLATIHACCLCFCLLVCLFNELGLHDGERMVKWKTGEMQASGHGMTAVAVAGISLGLKALPESGLQPIIAFGTQDPFGLNCPYLSTVTLRPTSSLSLRLVPLSPGPPVLTV